MSPEEYKKIISMAIDREVEAYTFYKSVTDKVKDKNLKKLFLELAGEETQHRDYLQGLLSKGIKAMKFSASKDYKVGDSIKTPPLTPGMKPVDGLVVAIKKELEAMQIYHALANNSDDAEMVKMFTELENMECGHKARLEDLYIEMAFPEAW